MPGHRLELNLTHDQLADLANALEDYRDHFLQRAREAELGFGLEPSYWEGRSREVADLLEMVETAEQRQSH